jgi:hypothetical protein
VANKNPTHKFKKGNNANPRGAGAHDPAKREFKKFTKEAYRNLIEAAFNKTIGEVESILDNEDSRKALSPMEFTILRSLIVGAKSGNPANAELFATRIIGKIPDQIKVESTNLSANATVDEVKTILSKLNKEI